MTQRQYSGDSALLVGIQEIGLMAKDIAQDGLPCAAVEKRCLRAGQNKSVPQRSAADVPWSQTFDGGHRFHSGLRLHAWEKDLIHPAPTEVLHQADQALLGATNVDVVPKARAQVYARHPRLLWVNLPGMKVKDR